jgi:integrase
MSSQHPVSAASESGRIVETPAAGRHVPRDGASKRRPRSRIVSVEKVQRAAGTVWRVRWRDPAGRPHSRVVGKKGDAQALDAELRRAKRLGGTALTDNSRETLAEFAKVWWNRYAVPNLQRHTLLNYASMLDVHIVPRLGDIRLRSLTPDLISEMRADMTADGVGEPAIRKTLVLLQSILERAVEWRQLDSNPARSVRKPSQRRTRVVRPLSPSTIEAMRAYLLGRDQQLDATLVAVLAYAGLRPGETLGLRWNDIGERTVLVERSVAFGQLKPTKTGQTRTVRLLAPLTETLATWRSASPRSTPTDLIFPAPDGSPWNRERVLNWRKRTFAEAATAAGVPQARPYDLRHSFVSLLIAQGATVVEVARQAGHSPTMSLSTYAHLFDEFAEAPRTSAEEVIRAARAAAHTQDVSVLCPRPADLNAAGSQNPCKSPMRSSRLCVCGGFWACCAF